MHSTIILFSAYAFFFLLLRLAQKILGNGRRTGEETLCLPNRQTLLINFRLSSDAEIFVDKHQLHLQIGAKRAEMCMHCVHTYIPTELPFCMPPLVVG